MSPSGIGRIFSALMGVTPSAEISHTRIPDETPSKPSSTPTGPSDAAVVSLRTQSVFEEDARVRDQRVQRIKQQVQQGVYKVDTPKVATALIRELAE